MFCAPGLVFAGTEGDGYRFHVLRSRTRFQRYRGRLVPFSYFACLNSFSSAPGPSAPVFMFCYPGLVFDGSEGVMSCFHILRSRTRFGRCRGRRVPFSSFALPDSFSAVPRATGTIFIFCAPERIFGVTVGVDSRFHVLRFRTHFRRFRGRRVSFSCFAYPHSLSAEPRASGPLFMFCAPVLVFGGTEGVESRFHILLSRTRFR
jgi:hypothetical protein